MMGLYLFCSMILTWLCPLLFTVINETVGSLRFALAPIAACWAIACLILSTIDMGKAAKDAKKASLAATDAKEENTNVGGDGNDQIDNPMQPNETEMTKLDGGHRV